MTVASPSDFDSVPDEMMGELLREAEDCLQGTIQLALAADQRGTTMTGILGAGAVALLAAAAATTDALFAAFFVASIVLFVAVLLTAWSARPVDFFVGGYEPRLLSQCGGNLAWMRRCSSADIQNRILKNRAALESASRYFSLGVTVAGISPLAGVAAYLLAS